MFRGFIKQFGASEAVLTFAALLLAIYYRLVGWTNAIRRIPQATFFEPLEKEPVILALWHGEHFLMPFFGWRPDRLNILVSNHRDGEILVRAGTHFGLKFIRGSGDHGKEFLRKKGMRAFITLLKLLKRGESVVMTADVPKVSRVVGLGIVTLAKHSGCAIIPVAMVTSRRLQLKNWDRTKISLPFGRMVMLRGAPVRVASDADDGVLAAARRAVEECLNNLTAQAYAAADDAKVAASLSAVASSVPQETTLPKYVYEPDVAIDGLVADGVDEPAEMRRVAAGVTTRSDERIS
jgi:lysophospholipid acyltransferase (LPLAT)-like uncharacterized protein